MILPIIDTVNILFYKIDNIILCNYQSFALIMKL